MNGTTVFADEATPLTSKPTAPSTSARPASHAVALGCIACIAIALISLQALSPHGVTYTSLTRKDVTENSIPRKSCVTQPSPSFYLPALNSRPREMLGKPRHDGLRWGVLGLGRIAHDFTSVLLVSGCNVTAVASTRHAHSKSFAEKFSVPTYHASYEALASDPEVDIVYIATTNQNHMDPTLLMLRHGKNVMVEKPTAVRYADAKAMYDEARERGLFLMTNHWTRFFPLIKYLRRTFLTNAAFDFTEDEEAKTARPRLKSSQHEFHLGKVLAMHGDFSFLTPLSPSDRFLNHTLGGGVTLDVGCYLIELAILAAYDHYQSTTLSARRLTRKELALRLQPDGIKANGHGIYNGIEFPVDIESSFSLRYGGGKVGVWGGECQVDSKCDTISIGGKQTETIPNAGAELEQEDVFSMIATFQASFRRPSTFEVEYVFEHGRIVITGPANCPNEMTIYEYEPYGPLKRETKVSYPLPPVKDVLLKRYGTPNYPRAEGFAYVIDAIEKCMAENGVPGREYESTKGQGCLELEENTLEEQLVTVQVTEDVLRDMGYFHFEHDFD